MSKLLQKITHIAGLQFRNEVYVARIYDDKITVRTPYVKWFGHYYKTLIKKDSIRNPIIIANILSLLEKEDIEGAWNCIGRVIEQWHGDQYLSNLRFGEAENETAINTDPATTTTPG